MVNNEQIRNTRLDVLKVVCCILVIVLHSPQLCGGVVGEFIRALTAVAVPTFMAISGYLIFYVKEYTGKKYFKILIKYMTIFFNMGCNILNLCIYIITRRNAIYAICYH